MLCRYRAAASLFNWSLVTSIIPFQHTKRERGGDVHIHTQTHTGTCTFVLCIIERREKVMDFPHWWERENKPNVFFWLAGDGERCTLSRWSHSTMQCVESRIYTLTHALLSFSSVPVCTFPAELTWTWTMTATTRTTMTGTVTRWLTHILYCLPACQTGLKRIHHLCCSRSSPLPYATLSSLPLNSRTWRFSRQSHAFFTLSFIA